MRRRPHLCRRRTLALAAGAPWIARGYSGNPNQIAKLIAEAVAHPGFSFLHVMSQCITFCPEQTDWKAIVTEREGPALANADEAAKVFLHEDGFQTGLLYCEQRPSWPPLSDKAADESALAGLAASFRV